MLVATCIHTYVQVTQTVIYIFIQTCMPTHVYAHVRTHAYACTHAYICTPYTHTRTHMHTYTMYMYVVIVLATSYLTSIAAYTHASMLITESI